MRGRRLTIQELFYPILAIFILIGKTKILSDTFNQSCVNLDELHSIDFTAMRRHTLILYKLRQPPRFNPHLITEQK